ncbi:MAG: hypothetical protein IRZ03_13115 [Acidobacterium ailaaui]|jgi:hypothetical protein|nr:hypothetical protein [Pseudacidobacterium ailaaui]
MATVVNIEQLEEARERGEARLVLDYPKFRRYLYQGFRFDCVPLYVRDWAPFGLSGWALYRRGWRIKHSEPDDWEQKRRKRTA